MAGIDWHSVAFDALSLRELEAILAARQQVFVIEQQCLYLDIDGADARSHHLCAWSTGGNEAVLLAYARIVAPGVKYPEPAIGRVLTTQAGRGRGLGRALIGRAVEVCSRLHPGAAIRISRAKRSALSAEVTSPLSTLMATPRSCLRSWARYTVPIPPRPISRSIL